MMSLGKRADGIGVGGGRRLFLGGGDRPKPEAEGHCSGESCGGTPGLGHRCEDAVPPRRRARGCRIIFYPAPDFLAEGFRQGTIAPCRAEQVIEIRVVHEFLDDRFPSLWQFQARLPFRQTNLRSLEGTLQLSVQAFTFLKELDAPRPPRAALVFHLVVQQLIEQWSGIRRVRVGTGLEVRRLTGKSGRAKAAGEAAAIARTAVAMLKILVFIFLVSVVGRAAVVSGTLSGRTPDFGKTLEKSGPVRVSPNYVWVVPRS